MVLAASALSAEVIHLKNGDVIYADGATEKGNNVTYEVGDNVFTIPKSRVQSIETGARPAPNIAELPQLTPESHLGGEDQLLDKIVHENAVDRSALTAVESRGRPNEIALAYYIAARAEFQTGKYNDSRRDFETALRNDPENPTVLNYYAALLARTMKDPPLTPYAVAGFTNDADLDCADAVRELGYHPRGVREGIESCFHRRAP